MYPDQTCRQKDAAATVDLGFGFIPKPKNCKRNDIIPVLISQQEDGGRLESARCAGHRTNYRTIAMPAEVYLTSHSHLDP